MTVEAMHCFFLLLKMIDSICHTHTTWTSLNPPVSVKIPHIRCMMSRNPIVCPHSCEHLHRQPCHRDTVPTAGTAYHLHSLGTMDTSSVWTGIWGPRDNFLCSMKFEKFLFTEKVLRIWVYFHMAFQEALLTERSSHTWQTNGFSFLCNTCCSSWSTIWKHRMGDICWSSVCDFRCLMNSLLCSK